jgi:tol-pal system protein YbgF
MLDFSLAINRIGMISVMTRGLSAAAFVAAIFASTLAAAQDGGGSPLSVLDRMFGPRPQANVPQAGEESRDPVMGSPTDQVLRIERLEAQIRQMTGTIEQLQFRNRQLEEQIRNMGGVAGGPPPGQPGGGIPPQSRPVVEASAGPAALPAPAAGGRRSDVFDPARNPNAPGAPHTLGSISSGGAVSEPPPIITAEPPVGAPGGRGVGAPLDLANVAPRGSSPSAPPQQNGPLPPPPSRSLSATGAVASVAPPAEQPKEYYDLGYGYVLRKDYALAEETFQTFLKKFPSDRRAADAQFWIGETLFQRQRYDAAAQAFLELSTKYNTHAKAPEALLRLGQSLAALQQKEMACATFAEVSRKYPKASGSVKQGVEREQKRVHC